MTQEEIEKTEKELKEKGVRHNMITAFLDEDDTTKTATFFLRKPDMTVRGLIEKVLKKEGGLKAVYAAIKNLHIAGDSPEILHTNDYALMSCDPAVTEMLQVHTAILKKN
jgi:hypothetical protein